MAFIPGVLAGQLVSPVGDELKALRRRHLGAPGTIQPKTKPARKMVRAVKSLAPNPRRKKRAAGGFDAWQPDLFGGRQKERGEGRTRTEQMELARSEMRDTGSPSLFEWLEGDRDRRKRNPGIPWGWIAAGVVGLVWLNRTQPPSSAPSDGFAVRQGHPRSFWPLGSSTG